MVDPDSEREPSIEQQLADARSQVRDAKTELPPIELPSEPSKHFVWIVLGSAFLVLAVGFAIAWSVGLLDNPGSADETKTIGAVLVLLGLFVSETVVVVGLLVSRDMELRNHRLSLLEEMRLRFEADQANLLKWVEIARQASDSRTAELQYATNLERAAQQQHVDNSRLQIETMIGSLELLSDGGGQIAHPSTQAGAIAALVELGNVDFAIGLLQQRLAAQDQPLDASSALAIVDRIIADPGSEPDQIVAAIKVLEMNAGRLWRLDRGIYAEWPVCAHQEWPVELPERARRSLIVTAVRMFQAHAESERSETPTDLEVLFCKYALQAYEADDVQWVKTMAICLIRALLPLVDRTVAGTHDRDRLARLIAEDGNSAVPANWQREFSIVQEWAEKVASGTSQ